MATIKERAKEWAEEQLKDHRDYSIMSDKVKKVWRESYINDYCNIATEQEAIDDAELAEVRKQRDAYYDELLKLRVKKLEWIDKACDWISENYEDIQCSQGRIDDIKRHLADFRKAMEE